MPFELHAHIRKRRRIVAQYLAVQTERRECMHRNFRKLTRWRQCRSNWCLTIASRTEPIFVTHIVRRLHSFHRSKITENLPSVPPIEDVRMYACVCIEPWLDTVRRQQWNFDNELDNWETRGDVFQWRREVGFVYAFTIYNRNEPYIHTRKRIMKIARTSHMVNCWLVIEVFVYKDRTRSRN